MGIIYHANSNQKSVGVTTLKSEWIEFKTRIFTGNKEGHFLMIIGSIHQEAIIILSIYVPNAT